MLLTVKIKVDEEAIADLLSSAFESSAGSRYWYQIESEHKPMRFKTYCGKPTEDHADRPHVFNHVDYPMNPGGWLMISSLEEPKRAHVKLNRTAIERGLALMAKEHPRHFADLMTDNSDAITADVFLQLALYGEVIYS